MCFALSVNDPKIDKIIKEIDKNNRIKIAFDASKYHPYYFVSGFSFPELPVLVEDRFELYQWGLIPAWIKDQKSANDIRSNTLNAKSETIFEKPSFRNAIETQRCILPINGFFEWQTLEKEKQPYYIQPRDKNAFYVGGLYDCWTNPETGEIANTFSIITTDANPLMAEIHNSKKRMPLIINDEDLEAWVDGKTSKQIVQSLFRPYEEKLMLAHPISKLANSPKYDRNVPEILNPITIEPTNNQLSLF